MIYSGIQNGFNHSKYLGFILVCIFVTIVTTAQAQQIDESHLKDVATPEEVLARITGDDEFDVDAKRWATLRTLQDAIRDYKAAQGRQDLTPVEKKLFLSFKEAASKINYKYDARIDEFGRDYYHKFRAAAFAYDKDPRDEMAIVQEFAPSLASGLAAKWGAEAQTYEKRKTDKGQKQLTAFGFVIAVVLFVILLMMSIIDGVGSGISVNEQGAAIKIKCRQNKYSPIAPLSFYPFYLNVGLFLCTLGFALALVIIGSGDAGVAWLDKHVPLPKSFTPTNIVNALILMGKLLLVIPWPIFVLENVFRIKSHTITVSKVGITADGQLFNTDDIDDIFYWGYEGQGRIDNAKDFVITGQNAAARAAESGRMFRIAIGNSWALMKRQINKKRFQLCLEINGQRHVIARKLSLKRVQALLSAADSACDKMGIV